LKRNYGRSRHILNRKGSEDFKRITKSIYGFILILALFTRFIFAWNLERKFDSFSL